MKLEGEAEYFDLKLTLSDDAPQDASVLEAGIWGGMAAVASSRHTRIAWLGPTILQTHCQMDLGSS